MVALKVICIWLVAMVGIIATLAIGVVGVAMCRKLWFVLIDRLDNKW